MKLAIYTLAGVMIAGLATGLALSSCQPAVTTRQDTARREVYVDIDRLVQLHPAWEALSMTKSAVADVRTGSSPFGSAKQKVAGGKQGSILVADLDPATRERLVTETIASAGAALRELEVEQRQAIDIRLRMRRETMENSAQAEVMVGVHEIEERAARSAEQVVLKHCPDRINAELKVAALKTESDSPGTDAKVAKSKIAAAETNLNQIKDECVLETKRVWDDAKDRIDSLLADAATRTDASLAIYESGETRKISDRAASARGEILGELQSLYAMTNTGGTQVFSANGNRTLARASRATDGAPGSFGDWRNDTTGLERRIRQDVKCAVAKIAYANGMTVVFSRSSNRIPDETRQFAQLMTERAWHGCGPVISLVSRS
ncbi:MAG: hypothetical protein ACYC64_01410 [Armatimonadota bacterium]